MLARKACKLLHETKYLFISRNFKKNSNTTLNSRLQLSSHGTKAFTTASSVRLLQPLFGSWQERRSQSDAFVAAAALSAGFLLGAGSIASCDSKKTNAVDPHLFPFESSEKTGVSIQATSSAPRDPMTVYAKMAIKREVEDSKGASEPVAQATSPKANGPKPTVIAEKVVKKPINEMSANELRIEEATRKAKQHSGGLKVFSGNGNMALSLEIARHLGINLGRATVGKFADGEANVVIHENVRGKDVYVVQPTCPPVNDNIMELLLMVSTLRRASARRITVVIPYYGYARQDRKMQVSMDVADKVHGVYSTLIFSFPPHRPVYPFLLPMLRGLWKQWVLIV